MTSVARSLPFPTEVIVGDKLSISIGPQHPGSGHFRIIVVLEGDIVSEAIPDPGYVHRGAEKMCEFRNFVQNVPMLERTTLPDANGIIFPYILAVEELMGIQAPPRAQYLRIISAELNRIVSHLYWLGIYGVFLGHSTMFLWPMGDRELFMDLIQTVGGTRVTPSYIIPGGARNDLPDNFKDKALKAFGYFERRLKEYDRIFFSNPLVLKRSQGVGVLKRSEAIALGITGPNLRGSGLKSDTRKDEPYSMYETLDFDIPSYPDGDCWARGMVRFHELYWSMQIIKQAVEKMPSGPFRSRLPLLTARAPAGEAVARTEAARGCMSYYVVSDGTSKPYRVRVSVPSFRNMIGIPYLLKGGHLADVPPIYWSLDYWPVEADK